MCLVCAGNDTADFRVALVRAVSGTIYLSLLIVFLVHSVALNSVTRVQMVPWCPWATGGGGAVNSATRGQLLGASEWKQQTRLFSLAEVSICIFSAVLLHPVHVYQQLFYCINVSSVYQRMVIWLSDLNSPNFVDEITSVYGRPMEYGRSLYFHPVVSSSIFYLFFLA